ncbi:hypothetical protein RV11_GL000326 [Enterococcus phoeniculicola]|jgi:uncharacterized membrane protein|uniref:ABC transporter permease n=1 Tax=Enterococcus phoeniculicola ATCC BAA-412 TaxID=1158610 RepID=R3TSF2_9ENTE|nr:putative ABC transporter permease [Enterococcus phoeniculicola]EOL44068.1 hypothetical protein UC3_01698 [Enterococcus phoeniculicola ATCC BAA-412]EOT75170.1 hypothetical protein I589_02770 [Enterococcus phoeniculicola ATCC BAA-412]OJG71620.1 hypothetical protein RV11_GL000326 [Enterococcus phoeniculicola]
MQEFIKVVLLFFLYSFVGWLWETVYCSLKAKHFVYRGFLVGPITPIYGFGILGVLYFIEPFQKNLILLYVLSIILVTVLEYLTSYVLEKLFHATWWDYHDVPLNLNGRVALPVSLFWGVGCVLIVRVIHPKMLGLEQFLSDKFSFYLPVLLLVITAIDFTYTVMNMTAFKKATQQLGEAIELRKSELQESFDETKGEFTQKLEAAKENAATHFDNLASEVTSRTEKPTTWLRSFQENPKLKANLPKLNFTQRRLLKSFPKLKLTDVKSTEEIRQLVELLKKRK